MKRVLDSILVRLVPVLANLLIRGIRYTMRISYVNSETIRSFDRNKKNYILAFWHGRLLMMLYSYPGKRISTLISRHRDGEYIARTMRLFGYDSTRGSTTEGGLEAMKKILRKAKSGYDIAFTPDGPRGPRQKVQAGVIKTARLSGLPIIPVSFSASRKKVFQSWDRFLLPLPFSQGVFLYGDPILVSKESDAREMEERRIELEDSLNRLTEEADHYFMEKSAGSLKTSR